MDFMESVRIALRGLSANKLRSALTMLGIIIGVAAVITLLSVGQGVQALVMSSLQSIGSNLLIVIPGSLQSMTTGTVSSGPGDLTLLNFDFHPDWMRARWGDAGFRCEARRALSLFRLPALKRAMGAARLARWDGALQGPASLYPLSPSVMVRLRHAGDAPPFAMYPLFRCPNCDNTALEDADGELYCPACGRRWRKEGEIFDFKGQGTAEAL